MPDIISNQSGLPTTFDVGIPLMSDSANVVEAFKYYHYGPNLDGVDGIDSHLSSRQPLDADLTAIASIAATYGLLKKTAANTWSLDTSDYLVSPSQTGNSGKYLTTDGTTASWASVTTGTVTSISMTVPTGLSVSGSPITSSGTFALSLSLGYSIPTTSSQTNWDSAYTDRLKWDGGSTGLTASTGRTSLGATTVGSNIFTLTNPSAITFIKINADNSITTESASTHRTSLGLGTMATETANNYATIASPTFTGTVKGIEEFLVISLSDEVTALTTGTGKVSIRAPYAMTLTQIPRAAVTTASSSGLVTVDIKESGTSVLGTNKLTIDANEKTSTTAATVTTLADTAIADDAEITFDITTAGTGATGLKVTLFYKRA